MSDGVGADTFLCHGRYEPSSLVRVALDQCVDAEAGHWLAISVQEDPIAVRALPDQQGEFCYGRTPQRAVPLLAAFPNDFHRGRRQIKVTDCKSSGLVSASTGVVQIQKQSIVSASESCSSVRTGKQGVQLGLIQVADRSACRLLERHSPDLRAPLDVLRAVCPYEGCKGMNCSQTLITRRDRAVAGTLEICEKAPDQISRQIGYAQSIYGLVLLSRNERQQQSQRIAITESRVACEI